MNHLDLFSGIGGFSLAASRVWSNHNIHSFVENDPFCIGILKKNYPGIKIHGDIRTYRHNGTPIDIITGGFPCQPFSTIGPKTGKGDKRHLWPYMFEIINVSRPAWVVCENVPGVVKMVLDKVLSDMESIGYASQSFIIPALSVDARHRRSRVWIISRNRGKTPMADTSIQGQGSNAKGFNNRQIFSEKKGLRTAAGDFSTECRNDGTDPETGKRGNESRLGRVANGIPERMDEIITWDKEPFPRRRKAQGDKTKRLKALGNAIVPQVAEALFKLIKHTGYQAGQTINP